MLWGRHMKILSRGGVMEVYKYEIKKLREGRKYMGQIFVTVIPGVK